MSTYAVFGMTWDWALTEAQRKVRAEEKGSRPKPMDEWLAECREFAEAIMASTRCVKLTQLYDAPQFASDNIKLASRGRHRDLHIQARTRVPDEFTKSGAQKFKWSNVA